MADMEIPQNDEGYTKTIYLRESDGSVPDNMGDYTYKFKAWRARYPDALIADIACSMEDAVTGKLYYTIQSGGFTDVDDLKIEVEMSKAGVRRSTLAGDLVIKESG